MQPISELVHKESPFKVIDNLKTPKQTTEHPTTVNTRKYSRTRTNSLAIVTTSIRMFIPGRSYRVALRINIVKEKVTFKGTPHLSTFIPAAFNNSLLKLNITATTLCMEPI